MVPYLKDWIPIKDNESFRFYMEYNDPAVVYVNYQGTPCSLRVQTYNLGMFDSGQNWDTRSNLLASLIRQTNPDVIGLQGLGQDPYYGVGSIERKIMKVVDSISNSKPKGRNMLVELSELLPEYPYYSWQNCITHPSGVNEGIGFLSRFPLLNSSYSSQACLSVVLHHPKNRVQLFTCKFCKQLSSQNAVEVLGAMDQLDDQSPQILMGDLSIKNSAQAASHILEGKFIVPNLKGNLNDAWMSSNNEEPGPTFPSWNPQHRYDRIYYRNIADPLACQISGYAQSKNHWAAKNCSVYADFLIDI